ncbi:MAG: ATP-binding protein [Myxococcota bacterium]|nr:ATP-binding protein [Myxococcota bacterium]
MGSTGVNGGRLSPAAVVGLLDRLIPPSYRDRDPHERFRARFVVGTALGMAALSLVVALPIYLRSGFDTTVFLLLVDGVLPNLAIPVIFRLTDSVRLSASLLVLQIGVATVLQAYTRGEWSGSVLPWLAMLPLVAGFLIGRAALIIVAAIDVVFVLTIGYLNSIGRLTVQKDMDHFESLLSVLAMVCFVAGFAWIYESTRSTAARRASVAIKQLQEANNQLGAARDLAEEGSRAKMEFLARMSHEIRTPMSGVLGMNELLLQSELNSEQQDYAQVMRKSAKSLLVIIDDILDFSRVSTGRLRIETSDYDPRQPTEQAVALLAPAAHRKGLVLHCLVRPEVPRRLLGASDRIHQVLVNLIGNAIKYTEAGSIDVEVTPCIGRDDQPELRFSVRDTGSGFSPGLRAQLFEPFFQVDSSTTRRHPGTGLGLAICQELVRLMGGQIGVETTEGRGSHFFFTVPQEEPIRRNDQDLDWVGALAGTRVVWVGGRCRNLDAARLYLENWGLDLQVADALNVRGELPPDLPDHDVLLVDLGSSGETNAEAPGSRDDSQVKPILVVPAGMELKVQSGASAAIRLRKPLLERTLLTALCRTVELFIPSSFLKDERTEVDHPAVDVAVSLSRRVLVVEDNEVSRELSVRVLKGRGYEVDTAENGVEALRMVTGGSYAAVLMDCQMPELDGYDTTVAIRREEAGTARVPIIAVTAHALSDEKERCLHAGMDDFLSKPFLPQQLLEIVEKWASSDTRDVMDTGVL